ncbi:MAG: helix-turn-helix domain-containing protein [Clostridia bacterium]|nr:helix-turn-helix domain-containing protein [Clostridia bacterium]
MEETSEKMISLSEAKAALRCMRLGGFNEEEALDCLDETVRRVRTVTTSALVEDIIRDNLSEVQRDYIRKYWYEQKNTSEIARECGVSQASVYRTIERANEIIKDLMTPVMKYRENVKNVGILPLVQEAVEISAAMNSMTESLCENLRNVRIANALSVERLARALKISAGELEEIESGRKVPSIVTAMRYSAIFGLDITMNFVNGRGYYKCQKA